MKKVVMILGMVMMVSGGAYAGIVAYDGMNYDPAGSTAPPDLGAIGTGGIGWAGNWTRSYAGATHCYQDLALGSLDPGFAYPTSGNKLTVDGDNTSPGGNTATRQLSTPINFGIDSTTYISFLASATDIMNSAAYLYLYDAQVAGTLGAGIGMMYQTTNPTSPRFMVRGMGNSPTYAGTWTANTTYLIVGKIVTSAAGNDSISVAAFDASNPFPTAEPVAWLATTSRAITASYGWVRIDGRSNLTSGFGYSWDEVKITSDWASIPEPATMVLLGLGSLLMSATRKRK
jgi:hypothetical protein